MNLLQQSLEALEYHTAQTRPIERTNEAITALREAIEQGAVVAMVNITDEQIEKLAVKHEAFGFGLADSYAPSTHGFDPDGLIKFARALISETKEQS